MQGAFRYSLSLLTGKVPGLFGGLVGCRTLPTCIPDHFNPGFFARMASPRPVAFALVLLPGLLWVLPFVFPLSSRPLLFFYNDWAAMVTGIACFCISVYALPAAVRPSLPAIVFPLMLLAFSAILQLVLDPPHYASDHLAFVIFLAWAAIMLMLGALLRSLVTLPVLAGAIAWSAFIGGTLSALVGILQVIGIPDFLSHWVSAVPYPHPIGNVRQANHFSSHLMLGFIGTLYLHGVEPQFRGVRLVGGTIIVFALALVSSRSVLLYFLALAVLLFLQRCSGGERTEAMMKFTLCAMGFYLLLQWLLPHILATHGITVANAMDRLVNAEAGPLSSRVALWHMAWQAFVQHPLLGIGVGNFAWQQFLEGGGPMVHATHAHNFPLHIMATMGMSGLLPLCWLALLLARAIWRGLGELHLLPAIGMLMVIGIHSMLEFPLWYAGFLGMAAFLAGMLPPPRGGVTWGRSTGKAVVLISIPLLVGLLVTLLQYRSLDLLMAGKLDGAGMSRAIVLARANPILRPYADQILSNGNLFTAEHAVRHLALSTHVMRWRPTPRALYRQAGFLSVAGQEEDAFDHLSRVALLYPEQLPLFLASYQQELQRAGVSGQALLLHGERLHAVVKAGCSPAQQQCS